MNTLTKADTVIDTIVSVTVSVFYALVLIQVFVYSNDINCLTNAKGGFFLVKAARM